MDRKLLRIYGETHKAIKIMAAERGVDMIDFVAELVDNARPPNLADVEALLAGVAKRLDTAELDVSVLVDKHCVAASVATMVNGKPVREASERLDWAIDKLEAAVEAARENN